MSGETWRAETTLAQRASHDRLTNWVRGRAMLRDKGEFDLIRPDVQNLLAVIEQQHCEIAALTKIVAAYRAEAIERWTKP